MDMNEEHKEKEYSIFQIAFNLAIACIISGAIIALTYYKTAATAVQKSEELLNQSMKSLVTDAESFKAIDGKTGWYSAVKGGKVIAYVVPTETKGYGGTIKLLTAITPEGKIIDYNIISHNETPGLGDNASKDKFRKQFNGKDINGLSVVKDPSDKEHIQAMTGATISSKAVTKGEKEAVELVTEYKEGK